MAAVRGGEARARLEPRQDERAPRVHATRRPDRPAGPILRVTRAVGVARAVGATPAADVQAPGTEASLRLELRGGEGHELPVVQADRRSVVGLQLQRIRA